MVEPDRRAIVAEPCQAAEPGVRSPCTGYLGVPPERPRYVSRPGAVGNQQDENAGETVKRTYQPNKRRRARKHGFRHRMSDRAGRSIIKNRRRKGRQRLSA